MLDSLNTFDLIFNSVTTGQGTCTFDGTTVDCNLGILRSGQTVSITLKVTVDPGISPTQISNTARAFFTDILGADPDLNPATNTFTTSTTAVTPIVDLVVSKTVSANPATIGDPLTYTITVLNNGPDVAPGTMLMDQLPVETTFVSVNPSQGSCSTRITCSLGTIANGSSATVTVVVTPNSPGHINNTAFVFSNATQISNADSTTTLATDFVYSTSEFATWEMSHCPPFVLSSAPLIPSILNVAYIPTKFTDAPNMLTIGQVRTRARYIRDYYYQQSMCSVIVNPVIITDPGAADGWQVFPKPLAGYTIPAADPNNPGGQLLASTHLWIDSFDAASGKVPPFLVGQQAKFFAAVMVIETIPRSTLRGRAMMMLPVANNPLVVGLDNALKAGAIGTVGAALTTLGPLVAFIPIATPANTAYLLTLPELFEQGSVVISDQDDNVTWAHELGHALFGWWDYYGDTGNFFNRGDIELCPNDSCIHLAL